MGRKRAKNKAATGKDGTAAKGDDQAPEWYCETDAHLIDAVVARLESAGTTALYERDAGLLDWDAIAPASMTGDQAKARWEALAKEVPKRRTNLEIARIVRDKFNIASVAGTVLTAPQYSTVSKLRRRPTKLKATMLYPTFPKRPMSAFFIWAEDNRERVKAQRPAAKARAVQRILAQEWKAAPSNVQHHYRACAMEAMHKYTVALEHFYKEHPEARNDKMLTRLPLKRAKVTLQPPAPPPTTAYLLFLSEAQAQQSIGNLPFGEFVGQIAKQWQHLGVQEQDAYRERVSSRWDTYLESWEAFLVASGRPRSSSIHRVAGASGRHNRVPAALSAHTSPHGHAFYSHQAREGGFSLLQPPPWGPTPFDVFKAHHEDDAVIHGLVENLHSGPSSVAGVLEELWKSLHAAEKEPYMVEARRIVLRRHRHLLEHGLESDGSHAAGHHSEHSSTAPLSPVAPSPTFISPRSTSGPLPPPPAPTRARLQSPPPELPAAHLRRDQHHGQLPSPPASTSSAMQHYHDETSPPPAVNVGSTRSSHQLAESQPSLELLYSSPAVIVVGQEPTLRGIPPRQDANSSFAYPHHNHNDPTMPARSSHASSTELEPRRQEHHVQHLRHAQHVPLEHEHSSSLLLQPQPYHRNDLHQHHHHPQLSQSKVSAAPFDAQRHSSGSHPVSSSSSHPSYQQHFRTSTAPPPLPALPHQSLSMGTAEAERAPVMQHQGVPHLSNPEHPHQLAPTVSLASSPRPELYSPAVSLSSATPMLSPSVPCTNGPQPPTQQRQHATSNTGDGSAPRHASAAKEPSSFAYVMTDEHGQGMGDHQAPVAFSPEDSQHLLRAYRLWKSSGERDSPIAVPLFSELLCSVDFSIMKGHYATEETSGDDGGKQMTRHQHRFALYFM